MTATPEAEAKPHTRARAGWPRTALLSLGDKTGAVAFAKALADGGTKLIASGGTARHLKEAGLDVTAVETWTGFSDLLGGRVKTLHPHVHAPILARRGFESDMAELDARDLEPIDLVAVSLYAFEKKAPDLEEAAAVEEIDIGGVALLRAAAKNHADVIVVHEAAQYDEVLQALADGVGKDQRRAWAIAAFERTSRYDAAIASDLVRRAEGEASGDLPSNVAIELQQVRGLRYGENPHQQAAVYVRKGDAASLHASREGKALSYNNMLDLEAAVRLVWSFDQPACVIVKHNEPCGVAVAENHADAYTLAFDSDSMSAFGGIVALNGTLDGATAAAIAQHFVECVAAPQVLPEAEQALRKKKNLRLLALGEKDVMGSIGPSIRLVGPWALLQHKGADPAPEWSIVTKREPTTAQLASLRFAWPVAAAARSNAIVIAQGTQLIGLGSGQTSRVDAVDLALTKARRAGHEVQGAVLASDGFFPFADNIEHAAEAGISAIVQPGGSKRDSEVIEACDANGIAMMFTGRRTFRH